MKKIVVVGGIIFKDNKILLCQRGPGRSLENFWEFPGGKIENGESADQALTRELKEELNLPIIFQNEIKQYTATHQYDFGEVDLTLISCTTKGEPQLSEHINYQFVLPTEVLDFNLAPADIKPYKDFYDENFTE